MPRLTESALTPDIEGRYYSPKMQWWCLHAQLTDADGKTWAFYFWPALGSLDEAWIAALYTGDEVINLTEVHLPLGSLVAGREGVDVTYGSQFIKGSYPHYDVSVSGEHKGQPVSLELSFDARMPAFQAIPQIRGIEWNYIPQMDAKGVVRVGSSSKDVSGDGYLERRRGRFWTPSVRMGLWESCPAASPSGELSMPLFYKVWRNDDTPQLQTLTFTIDGKEMIDLDQVEVEFLEYRKLPPFEDIDHPMHFHVRASGDEGSAEIEVVRQPNRLAMRNYFNEPEKRSNATGFYGPGHTTGTIDFRGTRYEVNGDSFGSALFFTLLND